MPRTFLAVFATLGIVTYCGAQEAIPVSHPHAVAPYVEGPGCATGQCATGHCATGHCGTCNDCLRVPDIKKTQKPVYSCKEKEICIPNCGLFGHLFGCKGECQKIVVRQLVKKYRTEEECVLKCMTAEEAAKKYEADAKKAAESAPPVAPNPAKMPKGMTYDPYAPGLPVPVAPVGSAGAGSPAFIPGVMRLE